jgi:branched-chain amino acid transport system permease protein
MATAIFEQLINGAMMGSIYVLMALGMVLIFGVMQVLNFAHGVLFMIGGYFADLFFFHVTGSYPLSVIFSMLSLALIGIVLERAIFRALRQNLPMQIVASLGLILIIQNGVIQFWGPAALQMRTSSVSSLVKIGQLSFTVQHFVIIAVVAAAVVTLYLFLMRTRLGTAMRATSQHPEAAVVVGINPNRVYSITFAIACALAGAGGALLGPLFLIFPQMGDGPMLKALSAIIIGGMGSVPGAIIGGLGIGIIESLSTLAIPTDYRDTVVFAILILMLLLRPWGLFGVRVRGEY